MSTALMQSKPEVMQQSISSEFQETRKGELESLNDFDEQIETLVPTCGTITLTEEQKKILYASVNENDIEIRPDGLIYLPWTEYLSRLRDAFGMNWAIVPQGMPKPVGDYILWGFYLVVQGKLAGFAIGEQEYHATNKKMTWGDACEGSKSNALMRLCKGLGVSLELWRPSFVRQWKEKYAETYWDTDKYGNKKQLWRRKCSEEVQQKQPTTRGKPEGNAKKDLGELSKFIDDAMSETKQEQGASRSGVNREEKAATQKKAKKTVSFLESIYQLKSKIDLETFNQVCTPYEPIDQIHDRSKQIELYNKLKDVLVPALV